MAFEVACSQCEGRLMVEEAGVIVACPHCGAHLNIEAPVEAEAAAAEPIDSPDEQSTDITAEQPDITTEQPVEATSESEASPEPGQATDTPAEAVEQEVPNLVAPTIDEAAPVVEDSPANEAPVITPFGETAPEAPDSMPQFTAEPEPAQPPVLEPVQQPAPESVDPATHPEPQPAAQPQQPAVGSIEAPSIASVSAGRGISRHTFTLVRNYAVAMTIAVIFLVYKLLTPNMSALESLPDLKPQKNKDGTIGYKRVPEAAEMPPGHLLSLGESQRFGNLKVTPVRITKEPIEFVHHLGDTGVSREPGEEVVKLWFEFENVSTDQSIAPFDGLVFKRDERDWENIRSNNFVCRQTEKKEGGKIVLVYELNENDIWILKDQNVRQEIAPGEKLETYIPTSEEGVAQLMNSDEPLIWRVHFRKGYSPKNYGVTTVIEVAFDSSDIGSSTVTQPANEPASAPNA
ncbi:MAG: hypothetical protein ACI8P0_002718 [Planctomycetaceae bacterium]|jgi:hypothetical protein